MSKIKVEQVAGIVALSYLALIPAGAYIAHRRICEIDKDVNALWARLGNHDEDEVAVIGGPVRRIKEFARGVI